MIEKAIVSYIENGEKFSINQYEDFVDSYGLKNVWESLCDVLKTNGVKYFNKHVVNFYDIGRLKVCIPFCFNSFVTTNINEWR